jgi:hypothetical protein
MNRPSTIAIGAIIATVAMFATLGSQTAAHAADRMRLVSVPLDMPKSDEEALDNQALEGLYQGDYGTHMPRNFGGYLGNNVKTSGLDEVPFYHIDTGLKDGRNLKLWFSSIEDGRKIFGVRLETPWIENPARDAAKAQAEVEKAWGKPDLIFNPPSSPGAQQIEVFIDPAMDKARYDAVIARLPAADKITPKDKDDFWRADLYTLARILGPRFRGAIAITSNLGGKLTGQQVLLIDLVRARTVFNLGGGN